MHEKIFQGPGLETGINTKQSLAFGSGVPVVVGTYVGI